MTDLLAQIGVARMIILDLVREYLDKGYFPGSHGSDVAPVATLGHVDPDAIEAAADFWSDHGITKEFDTLTDRVHDAVAAVQQRWEGPASDSFSAFCDKLVSLLRELRDTFGDIGQVLADLAQSFRTNAYEVIGILTAIAGFASLIPPIGEVLDLVLALIGVVGSVAQLLGSLIPRLQSIDDTITKIKGELKKLGDVPKAGISGDWQPLTADPST